MKYLRPSTVHEVIDGLAQGGVILAGGTVLVPDLLNSCDPDATLLDLQKLAALRAISWDSAFVRIGAMVSIAELHSSMPVRSECFALTEASECIGNPQIRNAATVGGNLRVPNTDLPPAFVVLDAEVVQAGVHGEFSQPIEQFLESGSTGLITAVCVPRRAWHSRFVKFAWRAASGKTIVSIAAALTMQDGRIAKVRLAAGGSSSKPCRLLSSEQLLIGQQCRAELFRDAAHAGADSVAIEVKQGPGEQYRRHLVASGLLQVLEELTKL